MHLSQICWAVSAVSVLAGTSLASAIPETVPEGLIEKRQQFAQGEPIDASGKGGPILGKFTSLFTQSI